MAHRKVKDTMTAELVSTDANQDWGPQRSRTVTWHEPGPSTAKGLAMAGIDYLQAMVEGVLPPHDRRTAAVRPGQRRARARGVHLPARRIGIQPDRGHSRRLVCTLLDSVTGCALHSTLPQGKAYTSVEIKVSYLRAVGLPSGLLTATGTVVKSGSRLGFTEGVVTDGSGAVVATATSTLLVFDL